jgi:calcium-dependent protein kinase
VVTYQLVSAERPFWGSSAKEIFRKICEAKYNFDGPIWRHQPDVAKDFVKGLLTIDPNERFTAERALRHMWLQKSHDRASDMDLNNALTSMRSFSQKSEFQKLALQVVARKSTHDEIAELRNVFRDLDEHSDGYVTLEEFQHVLQGRLNSEEIDRIFREVDDDENGMINYTEFLACTLDAHGRIEEHRLADAFDRMDADDNGYITMGDLKNILGRNVTDAYIKNLIREVDTSGDGRISFSEFKAAFEGHVASI